MTTKTKPKAAKRPFKMFYCDRDEIFLLPHPAFKLWMFYYRLEGAKREGWASRETIHEKTGLDKETQTKWREWLVENGWMKQIRVHKASGNPGVGSPVMCVTRGSIPSKKIGSGLSPASRANLDRGRAAEVSAPTPTGVSAPTVATGSFRSNSGGKQGRLAAETSRPIATGSFRREVDVNLVDEKRSKSNPVDGGSGSDFSGSQTTGLSKNEEEWL